MRLTIRTSQHTGPPPSSARPRQPREIRFSAPSHLTANRVRNATPFGYSSLISENRVCGANESLYQYTYGYDLAGNVSSVGETYPGGLNSRTVTNTYDGANRLVSEAVSGSNATTTSYAYDAANNRASKIVTGGSAAGTTSYNYNALNQLTSYSSAGRSVALTYDTVGNRTRRVVSGTAASDAGTDTYSYDFENRLISVTKAAGTSGTYAYGYDYRTRRVVRDETNAGGVLTNVVFSGGVSVQEYDGGATMAEGLAVSSTRCEAYSFYRPRDIITMLGVLKDLVVDANDSPLQSFPESLFESSEFRNQYGDYLMGEIKDHLAFYYSDLDYEVFLKFFDFLKGRRSFEYAEYLTAFGGFQKFLDDMNIGVPAFCDSPDSFLQFLYELNVLSYIEEREAGRFYRWCFRERSYSNIAPKITAGLKYEIHWGIANAVNTGSRLIVPRRKK